MVKRVAARSGKVHCAGGRPFICNNASGGAVPFLAPAVPCSGSSSSSTHSAPRFNEEEEEEAVARWVSVEEGSGATKVVSERWEEEEEDETPVVREESEAGRSLIISSLLGYATGVDFFPADGVVSGFFRRGVEGGGGDDEEEPCLEGEVLAVDVAEEEAFFAMMA